MRLLIFLLLPALALGFYFQEEDDEEFIKILLGLRAGTQYDDFEFVVLEVVQKAMKIPGKFNRIVRKVTHQVVSILEETVPHSAHPTSEQLTQLSDELATSFGRILKVFKKDHALETSDLIFHISSMITSNLTQFINREDDVSPSKFANAVSRFGPKSPQRRIVYELAAIMRCMFDVSLVVDDSDMSAREGSWGNCSGKFGFESLQEPTLWVQEFLEHYQSRKNVNNFVMRFSTLMEALKKSDSYESAEAFAENVKVSPYLSAITQIYISVRNCTDAREWNSDLQNFFAIADFMKVLMAGEEEPTIEQLREAGAGIFSDDISSSINLMETTSKLNESVIRTCLLQPETFIAIDSVALVVSGNAEEESFSLRNVSKPAEAVIVLCYQLLRELRNRVDMTEETNRFFTKVFDKFVNDMPYAEDISNNEEGTEGAETAAVIQANIVNELREDFSTLSVESKRMLADHFPCGTAALLAVLY